MINKALRLIKNPKSEFKALIENLFSLSLLQLVSFGLPLLTLPYIAKTVGLENFGRLAVATSIIVFFTTVVDYGFKLTGIRDIARVRGSRHDASVVFSRIMYARCLLFILSILALTILYHSIDYFKSLGLVLWFTFLIIPGHILFPEWFFQGIEKMKYSSIMSALIKFLFTISIFIFVRKEDDYIKIPIINAVGFLIVGAYSIYIITKKYNYYFVKVPLSDVLNTIRNSTNVFITLIVPNFYTNLSMIFVGSFWGNSSAGIFEAGNKFVGISQQITDVFSRAFYPFLSRKIEYHDLYVRISLAISIFVSVSLFFLAEHIVFYFYDKTYAEAVHVIKVMSISPFFFFLMNAYGTNYLIIEGYEKQLRNIVIICSLLGLLLSFTLVKELGYIGAAITITLVWGFRGFATMYYALKIKKRVSDNE